MGSELKFSTANHPQTDGQKEKTNSLLEEYLRHYVTASQHILFELLDTTQFCHNLQKSSPIGFSPFRLAMGWQLLTPYEVAKQNKDGVCPGAHCFFLNWQEMLEEERDSLEKAALRMKKYVDLKRRALEFDVGDQVMLKLTP